MAAELQDPLTEWAPTPIKIYPRHCLLACNPAWASAKPGLEANQLCLLFPKKIEALALKQALVPRLFLAIIRKRPVKDLSKTPFLPSP